MSEFNKNKRQALQSPPSSSELPATQNDIRIIIKEVIREEFESFLGKLNADFRTLLNNELKLVREEITEIRGSIAYKSIQYADVIKENKDVKEQVTDLQHQNKTLKDTIKDLNARMIKIEQGSRANNVEIQCVHQKKNENFLALVIKLGNTIKCDVKEENITHCIRTPKFNSDNIRAKSIVVQFTTAKQRDNYLAAAINFNKLKFLKDKLNISHIGLEGKSPIFISEHLCPANKALHAAARLKAKEKGFKYVWIRGGRIHMRKNDESEHKIIKDKDSLNKLV